MELPSGTVTFLFTDVEGSTRLLQRLGDDYAAALADHHQLLRAAFEENGGQEIDTQGDAFFFAFRRAKDAVGAALSGQRALAAHPWPAETRLRVRMGLHTGEPAVADTRYVGLGVHRAARICAAGHGGQILLSQATHAVLADDNLAGVSFRDLGEYQLKDLDRGERIYQLLAPGLPSEFPSLRASTSRPTTSAPPRPAHAGNRALRVAVADDSVLLRQGLCRLLEDAGFELVAQAGDAAELLREVHAARPDVAVTDIKMPPTHTTEGLDAAEQIRDSYPETGVLVLSQYLESRYAARLLESFPERIGYLLKDRISDVAVLTDAIRRISEGECVIDPTIVSRLMSRARQRGPLEELSEREQDLLALVAEGRTDDAIGERLGIESNQVDADIRSVFERLGLRGTPNDLRRVVSVLDFLRS
jgi:DNA-binding NarL/FixJ family response regulator/class 3 adenylate cyclase